MRHALSAGIGLAVLLAAAVPAAAQNEPLVQSQVNVDFDSGAVTNDGTERGVIFTEVVHVPEAGWLRLRFSEVVLGRAPAGGTPTELRITSLHDGHQQRMNAMHVEQWKNTTAYFNGGALLVEIVADPGADPSRLRSRFATAGPIVNPEPVSICGPTDDRELSTDPRAARLVPIGCTGWLIDDANHCFLTAGHCGPSSGSVMEFNVPLSQGNGSINHPGPEDQYIVDDVSVQSNGGQGVGNDWAYYGCFENTNTGLTAAEAQGDWFVLATAAPPGAGQDIRITGYGTTSSPVPPEWNQAQKTHVGPYQGLSGTAVTYQTDTTGGNSGSPVIDETSGMAIGIHTHGGCANGANNGTAIEFGPLQNALANPQGVCIPSLGLDYSFPEGLPELIDPAGDTIRVVIVEENGGQLDPATPALVYDDGSGPVSAPMVEVSPLVYDAVFPALDCPGTVSYYITATTLKGDEVTEPFNAPDVQFSAGVGDGFDFVFADDFETDMGWGVTNDGNLTDGAWERGVPIGGGDRGDPPNDADGSGRCYLTDNVDGNSDVDGGATTLTSPPLDATQGDAHLTYWRWLDNTAGAAPGEDVMLIEITGDGGTWVELETVGPTGPSADGGWEQVNLRVADFITPTASVRVRFTVSDLGAGSVVEAGVDGVRMNQSADGVLCDGDVCVADLDGSGDVGTPDLLQMLAAWGLCGSCPEDLNDDGEVNVVDLLDLVAAWGSCL